MAKLRTSWVCDGCGGVQVRWAGKCPDCGAWDSLKEFRHEGSAAPAVDGDGAAWCEALARCAERDVRVVVLKAGRSTRGAAVGAAHTAALVGDQAVFAAMITEAGGVMVTQPLELLETARALALGRRDSRGAAFLTCSGGDAAIAADLADDLGVRLADLATSTEERLRALLPPAATVANPLDHTALVWADTEAIAALAESVGRDPAVGHLVYVQDEPPGLPAGPLAEWRATRAGGVLGGERAGTTTLVVATTPGQAAPGAVAGLDNALRAIRALQSPMPEADRLRDMSRARRFAERSRARDEVAAKALLAQQGIAVPGGRIVHTAEDAVPAARALGYPVVLKVVADGVIHKSDIGGVVVGINADSDVARETRRLLGLAPDARVLVEAQAEPGVEMIVAARREGVVPTLTVGLGGIWTEAFADVACVPLPATPGRVRSAIEGLRAYAVLAGGRGRAAYDMDGLCLAASRIGDLLLSEGLSLIEVNPLIVGHADCVAVDAVMA